MTEHVIIERRGAAQLIRMNRPDKKNALTRAMYAAMNGALRSADADKDVRVHVFLGVPGAFCAGNDIADFLTYAEGGALGEELVEFLVSLATVEKPMVSGVDGIAVGIGTTLNLHCDLTFATRRTVFRTPFVDLGLVPEAGSSLLAPGIIGRQQAFALLALGHGFSADRAKTAGLIYDVVDEDDLEKEVFAAAEEIARKPPEALRIARELIRGGSRAAVIERIHEEVRYFSERLRSAEARAAFMAFMNRKKG
jgi:enoyl-CoA hydratase/carnithine racemase